MDEANGANGVAENAGAGSVRAFDETLSVHERLNRAIEFGLLESQGGAGGQRKVRMTTDGMGIASVLCTVLSLGAQETLKDGAANPVGTMLSQSLFLECGKVLEVAYRMLRAKGAA